MTATIKVEKTDETAAIECLEDYGFTVEYDEQADEYRAAYEMDS
jgi:hypothetical protein